jgi:nicotinate dehydrogenase subunit B
MVEIERYELAAGPLYRFEPDRRDFLKLFGGGILVFLALAEDGSAQESGRARGGGQIPQDIAAWLHIGEDGKITIFSGKVEFGQNIRTSLTQAVAEELGAAPESVRLVMGDTDLTPFDMGTFGSRTTPTMAPQLRRAAACAREMLLDLAAEKLAADRATLRVADGGVHSSDGKALSFGELTHGKELVKTIGHDPGAKPSAQSLGKVDGRSFVTGAHRYTSDLKRPGMLYGAVLRPPAMNSTLVSVDSAGAEQIAGVQVVHEANFVGVVGADRSVFPRAFAAIDAKWKTEPQPSAQDLFRVLKEHPKSEGPVHSSGSFDAAWSEADHKLEASYRIAYIAHTPMETRAALAEWNAGKLTVWTGTQRPFGVRTELAQAFQIPENRIRVIVPDTGAGYGGKHTGECAIEAARLAKAAGKPVKLTWTREEEFAWAYFRPAGVIDVRGAVRKDGSLTAWEFHNYNSGASGLDTPYDVSNQIVKFHTAESPLRQGSYRGLAATANHFARESHMDELAHAAGLDPLEFRLKNLKDARMKAVLEAAAKRFGWGKSKAAAQRGFGIACGFEKGGYVASCAEVSIAQPGSRVKIERVVTAFECGAIVNPEHLKNQVEGAVVMGIGGALFETIDFADGKILNGKLSRYRVPRFSDLPVLETVLIDRKDIDSAGAGETPIVALAPAVGNAIFHAVGMRLRSLPMAPNGVSG